MTEREKNISEHSRQEIIEINFGASSYVRNAPGVPYSESIIRIPETGRLPTIGEKIKIPAGEASDFTTWINIQENWVGGAFEIDNYPESVRAVPQITAVNDLPAVRYRIPTKGIHEIIALWVEARNEWVAIYRNEWFEGMEEGNDELYLGPFALDEIVSQKILQAYNLTPGILSLENVRRTKPERLQYLIRNQETREMLLEGNVLGTLYVDELTYNEMIRRVECKLATLDLSFEDLNHDRRLACMAEAFWEVDKEGL